LLPPRSLSPQTIRRFRAGDFGHPGKPLAPLAGALEVTHPIAGEHEMAPRETDRDRIAHLPSRRGRRRLVQARHPLRDLRLADTREPVERDCGHLEVDVSELPPERLGLCAALTRQTHTTRQGEGRPRSASHPCSEVGRQPSSSRRARASQPSPIARNAR
jgi:hypothetical protein